MSLSGARIHACKDLWKFETVTYMKGIRVIKRTCATGRLPHQYWSIPSDTRFHEVTEYVTKLHDIPLRSFIHASYC